MDSTEQVVYSGKTGTAYAWVMLHRTIVSDMRQIQGDIEDAVEKLVAVEALYEGDGEQLEKLRVERTRFAALLEQSAQMEALAVEALSSWQ